MSASNKRSYDSYAESAGTEADQKAAGLLKVKNQIHTMVLQIPPRVLHNLLVDITLKDVAVWKKLSDLYSRLRDMDPSRLRSAQRVEMAGKQHPNATPAPATATLEAPTLEPPSTLDATALDDMCPGRHLHPIDQNVTPLPTTIPKPYTGPILDPKVITAKPLPKPRGAPKLSAQQPRAPFTFEHCCEAVWCLVNEAPGGRKNFKNYGVVFGKCDAVEDIIEQGIYGPALADAKFETRFNGLCALRDIGISIMGAVPSSFAKETRYSQAPRKIGDAMEAIIEDMTQEEKVLVWQSEGWVGDMRELKKALASYGVDFGVDEIIEMCRPNAEDEVEQANSGRIGPAVIVLD
jgi:hypothetical protein